MAKHEKNEKKSDYEVKFKSEFISDLDIHKDYITSFDAYEAMLIGKVYDSVSGTIDNSKITDSYAATLAKERADRVMAKLPEGETVSVAAGDAGKAMFMDILRQKWIYPNANSQHKFPIKLNLWQLYSDVYGYMPMFYDWNVTTTGYAGPDCWLWNPRLFIPQQGRTSVADMDYVTALTWVGKSYLKDKLGKDTVEKLEDGPPASDDKNEDGWNLRAIQELLQIIENQETDTDPHYDTLTERIRTNQSKKKGICLATRYEAGEDGEWVTFAPDHGCVEIRRIKNPHKNGRIPFVIKYSQALYDSFYGLGRFQRAKPIQYARDGLTNYYFRGIKMNLIPPLVVNANGVLKSTIDYREGAVMEETQPNSIRRLETSTAGLSTYQGAQSNMTGSLLSLFGSQNASLPGAEALNPSQGKTPQAIALYGDKEASQDGADRRMLETAIEELTDGFFSLVANIGTEKIPVKLYAKDIEEIHKSGLTDIKDLFKDFKVNKEDGGLSADLKVDPKKFKDIEMRFNIAPDSTAALMKSNMLAEWERMVNNIAKFQNQFKDDPRIDVNWGKIMEAGEAQSNIRGASEFITVNDGPSPQELEMQQQLEQMAQQLQQATQLVQQQQQEMQQLAAQAQQTQNSNVGGVQFNDPSVAEAAKGLL